MFSDLVGESVDVSSGHLIYGAEVILPLLTWNSAFLNPGLLLLGKVCRLVMLCTPPGSLLF